MNKEIKKKKIIVVEDDKFLRNLLVRKLKDEDFETLSCIEGNEALALIRKEMPNLVLLDLILPGMDGFEVLRQLKKDSNLRDIPVVILSNLGQEEEVKKGVNLGAVDYLIKAHFTPGEIIEKIKSVLGQK